ncbi:MAG: Calx-beta domain-containing protein [Panacibacter sp.]
MIKSIAQSGTLDSSFGGNGKSVSQLFGTPYCVAEQQDGKIIVAGRAYEGVIIVTRYNQNGTFDSSFGTNGKVLTDLFPNFNLIYSQALAMILQPDGKIVITGYGIFDDGLYGNYNVILARYDVNGVLDPSFGNNGILVSDFGDNNEFAASIALQTDGKIVIGGQSGALLIARYNSDGSPDITFGSLGWIKKYNGGFANSILIQPDGKIVTGGSSIAGDDKFWLYRIKTDGKSDSTFGLNGRVFTDFGVGGDQLNSIVLQPDGKIIGAGKTGGAIGGTGHIALIRYFSNGNLDSSFGNQGKVTTVIGTKFSNAAKVLLQPDMQIIVAGANYDFYGTDWDFAVVKYNNDGTLDSHFGEQGIQVTDMGGIDYGYNAALQYDGKILVVGSSGNYGFAIARYKNEIPITISFKKDEKIVEGNNGITKAGFKIIISQPSSKDISVSLATKDGTAIAGSDYKAASGILTIKAGHTSKNIEVKIIGDSIPENNERFFLVLSNPVNAILDINDSVTCTIKNDDPQLSATFTDNFENNNAASLKIYPNPVKSNLQVAGLSATQKTIFSITDLSGNRKATATVTGSSYNWNISELKQGNYILKIENEGMVVTRMFVKE